MYHERGSRREGNGRSTWIVVDSCNAVDYPASCSHKVDTYSRREGLWPSPAWGEKRPDSLGPYWSVPRCPLHPKLQHGCLAMSHDRRQSHRDKLPGRNSNMSVPIRDQSNPQETKEETANNSTEVRVKAFEPRSEERPPLKRQILRP